MAMGTLVPLPPGRSQERLLTAARLWSLRSEGAAGSWTEPCSERGRDRTRLKQKACLTLGFSPPPPSSRRMPGFLAASNTPKIPHHVRPPLSPVVCGSCACELACCMSTPGHVRCDCCSRG
jgi:hypothetical protein